MTCIQRRKMKKSTHFDLYEKGSWRSASVSCSQSCAGGTERGAWFRFRPIFLLGPLSLSLFSLPFSLSLSISFLLPPSLFFSSNVMKQNNRQLALVAVLCFVSFTVISRWMTVSSSIPLAPTTSLLEAFSSHHKEVSSTPLRSLSWSEVMLIYYPVFFCRTSRGPVCIRGKELQRL